MEDRDDLSELLLNGLPEDEREHVINVIKQGDAEKLRRKRAESIVPSQDVHRDPDDGDDDLDERDDLDGLDVRGGLAGRGDRDNAAQDGELADASE